MRITRPVGAVAAASVCALAGGAIGISQSAAASHSSARPTRFPPRRAFGFPGPGGRPGAPGSTVNFRANFRRASKSGYGPRFAGPGGRPGGALGFGGFGAVHSVSEVLNKAGTAYIAETTDTGTITAVDGTAGTITVKEGTSTVTYGTPTITIPSGAVVTLDGKSSSVGDLKAQDHVRISASSDGTTVFAIDSSFFSGAGPWGHPGSPPPRSSTATTTTGSG